MLRSMPNFTCKQLWHKSVGTLPRRNGRLFNEQENNDYVKTQTCPEILYGPFLTAYSYTAVQYSPQHIIYFIADNLAWVV